VFKALAKDRDDRYLDASDLAEDIQRYLLSRGKPPNGNVLGEFVRQNFTVDYDKERLRLESYKDIEVEEDEEPAPTAELSQPNAPAAPGFDPVAAAMADDRTGTFHGGPGVFNNTAAAPAEPSQGSFTAPGIAPMGGGGGGYVSTQRTVEETGIRPAGVAGPGGHGFLPAMRAADKPARGGGNAGLIIKIAAAIVAALLLVGGGVAAALLLAKGDGIVVVTVLGPKDPARVLIDGDAYPERASPSVTMKGISAGEHTLIIESDGYKTHAQPVVVQSGKTVSINVELGKVGGGLRVISEPAGAEILVDGAPSGEKTPATLSDVSTGKHTIELRLEGYKHDKKEVKVDVGSEKTVSMDLRPEAVEVRVVSTPAGAKVTLNGEVKGETPVTVKVDADATPPQLLLEKPGCKSYSTSVVVDGEKAKQDFVVPPLSCR
jgi:hypothetical protein